ncbi:Aromatic-L-amino-acid decarboxylase [Armadillidium nasatum]|uniref:Aromatic-L-amino-acid decarboxylase n=1 Tax=Armadillidium nasatum TaxID=96803 RepID=A0A5N5T6N6_9CRUS|nr:Aromatic-L-amino-acid decarboxylase [Armadillidium nasatum]
MLIFPLPSSYPAILADMLCGAIGCIGFSWISSPACTELEVVMLDWLGELIGLPKEFLAKNGTNGGGVIQGSASDATLVTLLSAKQKKLNSLLIGKKSEVPVTSLVAYASGKFAVTTMLILIYNVA